MQVPFGINNICNDQNNKVDNKSEPTKKVKLEKKVEQEEKQEPKSKKEKDVNPLDLLSKTTFDIEWWKRE